MSKVKLTKEQKKVLNEMKSQFLVNTTTLSRSAIAHALEMGDRDIDEACNYPRTVGIDQYVQMYRRNGVANRAVRFMSEESWKMLPDIYEIEDTRVETPFELAIKELKDKFHVFSYIKRADILSGIGRYGALLIGINDGKNLYEPVDGIDPKTGEVMGEIEQRKLIYLKPFREGNVTMSKWETDPTSPRFGMPVEYVVRTEDMLHGSIIDKTVHWSRVVHLADNREESDVCGIPRMESIYNMLLDIRKLLGGSAEMFWRGAFPGYSFEINPEYRGMLGDVEIDSDTIKEEFEKWSNGLQRYLALTGVSARSLSPQVSDPSLHLDAEFKAISLSIGVPYRVFIGTEEAKLASSQDVRSWNARIDERRNGYLTNYVIRPIFNRFIELGVIPSPKNMEYSVEWPDLNTLSDLDQAEVSLKQTTAMSTYVSAGVDQLVPPKEYLTMFIKKTMGEAEQIEKAAEKRFEDSEGNAITEDSMPTVSEENDV